MCEEFGLFVDITGLKVTVRGAFPALPFACEEGSKGDASVVAEDDMMRWRCLLTCTGGVSGEMR